MVTILGKGFFLGGGGGGGFSTPLDAMHWNEGANLV